ncbi:MAG: hypothetical protein JO291_05040 [Acidimicrobiia bacterium]|nr:hypothetical protein [Acidimicrobiia bacterium]
MVRSSTVRQRLGLSVAVLAAFIIGVAAPGALAETASDAPVAVRADNPLPRLASLSVARVKGDELISVRWSEEPAHARYTRMHLELLRVTASGRDVVNATIVGHTVEPTAYTIPVSPGRWAVRATPENETGFGPGVTSAVVTVTNPCPTATICTQVTASRRPSTLRLAGQGFLLSLSGGRSKLQATSQVTALAPQQWRFSGASSDQAARSLDVSRMQILSDLWNDATAPGNGGFALTPWSDWARWQNFVRATVRSSEQNGWAPDYWDVWNEPNGTCCPRFSPADRSTITVSRWLKTYVLAWQAIKSVDAKARVVGPSLSALQWAPGAPAEFDLDTFLAYSATHHVTWDAISWHENTTAPSPGDIAPSVTNVDRHIAMARKVMARHPHTVVNARIFINEYSPANVHMLPGWSIGYFRAFEDDGVSQANLACWDAAECRTQFGGLLTPAGRTTAVWWAHRAYARMDGSRRMQVGSTSTWQIDGLAVRQDRERTVRVLLGRHWSCNRQANAWCASSPQVQAASLQVTIAWPYGSAPVALEAWRIPAGTSALAAMPVISSKVVRPRSGTLTMTIPRVNDGDGVSIVAKPA